MKPSLIKPCIAEFIGTFALIFVGVGAIYHLGGIEQNGGLLGIALAHGLTIAVMASATGAISGGHLNPAVTFAMILADKIDLKSAAGYWVAQLAGATAAGGLLLFLLAGQATPAAEIVKAGTPVLGANVSVAQGIILEAVMTFFLVFVIFGTAVDSRAPKLGGLAIGLTVTLDILFGGPLTGAAMNPARTFGPALISGQWSNHLVYWVGPLLGAGVAALVYGRFLIKQP